MNLALITKLARHTPLCHRHTQLKLFLLVRYPLFLCLHRHTIPFDHGGGFNPLVKNLFSDTAHKAVSISAIFARGNPPMPDVSSFIAHIVVKILNRFTKVKSYFGISS